MPIQSAFTSQAVAEAPVARSRAGQTEPREGGEVFTLRGADAGPAEAGKAGAITPQGPNSDATGAAFLVAMAAAQTGSQAESAGEGGATGSSDGAVEGQDGSTRKKSKAAGEGEGDSATPVPVAEGAPTATPVSVAILTLSLPQGPGVAAEGKGIEASGGGLTKKDASRSQSAAAIIGSAAAGTPVTGQASAAGAVAQDGKAATGVHAAGSAGQGKVDQPVSADVKALDALQQQPAAPFDVSTLLQQASARAVHDNPDAAAAPGTAGQGTATGQPTPVHVVPIEIGLRAMSGARQFDIRLDPDELGRVDVNLSISDKGEVSARLVVDRVETLHLLQRDARTLERAFEQAGLKPSDGGVDITLRDPSDQSAFRQNRQQDEMPQRSRQPDGIELAEDAPLTIDPVLQRRLMRLGGVDLSI